MIFIKVTLSDWPHYVNVNKISYMVPFKASFDGGTRITLDNKTDLNVKESVDDILRKIEEKTIPVKTYVGNR